MAQLKVVLFYNQGQRGWTETYYANGASPTVWAQQFATYNYWTPFTNMRANDVTLVEVRVSQIGSPRVTYSLPFQLASENAYGSDASEFVQDTYGEDALLLVRSATGIPRHLWLRGLPNILIVYSQGGSPAPPALLISLIAQMQAQILQMGLQVQNVVVPGPTSNLWNPVLSATASPSVGNPLTTLVTTSQPIGVTAGSNLYFQGIPRNILPGFPRIIPVTGVVQTGSVWDNFVPYLFRGPTAVVYPNKMKFCALQYTYPQIASVAFETYGVRKTGRPSGLPRGRAPAVIRRS
jgi:hypothetical protein